MYGLSGWKMGFEPTTPGTTIQCSNQLSYIHHVVPNIQFGSANLNIIFEDKRLAEENCGIHQVSA